MNRRQLIHQALLLAGAPLVLNTGWAAATVNNGSNKKLVIVMLRGAVDGLNVVVPYQDPNYYQGRPNIALAKPNSGTADSVLDLDGYFGLNPALAPILPLWANKELAFIHAAGSPSESRSHFDAQDYMETGTPDIKSTQNGWLNRLLDILGDKQSSSMEAISVSPGIPRILAGKHPITVLSPGKAANRRSLLTDKRYSSVFDQLYAGNTALDSAYQSAQASDKAIQETLSKNAPEDVKAANGAPSVKGFAADARQIGTLMRENNAIGFAFFGLSGWDTHANQGKEKGTLTNSLTALVNGLVQLKASLGPEWNNTAVVVMSEFGRTVKENGNKGTDHGHGNVMWVLGGKVKGKKIYGQWPTLKQDKLFQGRDLAVTTDFRDVLSEVISEQFPLGSAQLATIFPKFQASPKKFGLITA